jgi:hypothetical protein
MQEKYRQGSGEIAICRNTTDVKRKNYPYQEQYRQDSEEINIFVDSADRKGENIF